MSKLQHSQHHFSLALLVPLVTLFVLGVVLRLVDVTDPPLDFHTSRQLRNSIVARAIYYDLSPGADEQRSRLAASFANSVGHYEPPVIESLAAATYLMVGGESYAVPRFWQTLFWILAGAALFDLARRAVSPWAGLAAVAYYMVLPFSVQASRSFQPDPLMTSAFVIGIYYLYRWSEVAVDADVSPRNRSWTWAILAGVFLGFAVWVKVVIAFLIGACAVALVLFTLRRDFWKSKQVWAMAFLMVAPAFLYYVVLHSGRSSDYFTNWSAALFKLVSSTDFYSKWLAFLGSLFGLTVLFASLAGALIATPRLRWLLVSLWIGYLAYGLTLPFQMYTHSYYHIQLIPLIALGLGVALNPLFEKVSSLDVMGRAALIALTVAVIGYHAWVARSVLVAEDFRHEPNVWENIAAAIPEDANVIALTQDYGFRLMYFGWRKVDLWPLNTDLAALKNENRDTAARFNQITDGNAYFLVTAFGQLNQQPELGRILDEYPVVDEGDGFVLYDLRH
jgi:4-amino-4-deoxy-L-arabinose transferase-like glycosyltransferase